MEKNVCLQKWVLWVISHINPYTSTAAGFFYIFNMWFKQICYHKCPVLLWFVKFKSEFVQEFTSGLSFNDDDYKGKAVQIDSVKTESNVQICSFFFVLKLREKFGAVIQRLLCYHYLVWPHWMELYLFNELKWVWHPCVRRCHKCSEIGGVKQIKLEVGAV